jgi:phosphonate transport system substrate-binding protein
MLAQEEPYQLIAGSSTLGFRENDKENVSLGFKVAFNALLSAQHVKCEFKVFDTSDALADAISTQQVNSFFGSPVEFIRSESFFLSSPLAGGIFGQKLKSKVYLLVRKDSHIDTLEQLKGKKLSTQKLITGDVGGLFFETLFLERKLPAMSQFFSEIQLSETSNGALVDLFFKKVDATLMSEHQFEIAAELNPQLRLQTKVLESSEPYLTFIAALTKTTPEPQINGIKNSLYSIHNTAKGRHILNLMKMQGFKEVSLSDLDNIRVLIEKNKRLKAKQNAY